MFVRMERRTSVRRQVQRCDQTNDGSKIHNKNKPHESKRKESSLTTHTHEIS